MPDPQLCPRDTRAHCLCRCPGERWGQMLTVTPLGGALPAADKGGVGLCPPESSVTRSATCPSGHDINEVLSLAASCLCCTPHPDWRSLHPLPTSVIKCAPILASEAASGGPCRDLWGWGPCGEPSAETSVLVTASMGSTGS